VTVVERVPMRDIEFRVLGPFEVLVEGRALELKRRKQRSLLALLMLRAGEVVSTDRLVEELWAGTPPKTAVGSLQNLVSGLRKALGRDTVRTREPGYMLDVDPDRVDLHRFERLVAQAAEGGDVERRSSLLREALGLWRGAPLADLAFEPFAHVEVARLEELRTAAREELVQAELELGRHSQLVGELETLVAENPLRERLRGQLMLALYRSGRQAEALEAYRQARETLVEELGIEPSPGLQRLEQSILRHDSELELAAVSGTEPATGEERRKTVTVLFVGIVDFASLGTALDPEVLRSIMRRYFDTVRTIVERHGGTVEKFIGDTAMAVFGIPLMHEDDALRAVRSAQELSEALIALNTELERDQGEGLVLQIRSGIDTGEVLVGDAASGQPLATGPAVTVAMRLQQAAMPGETLVGEATRAVLREAAALETVEQIEAGAQLGAVRAFRLLEVGDHAGLRPPTRAPFVGRNDELAALRRAFDAARAERRSRVVTVLGEAGIGKTRLISEFVESLGGDATVLVGRCVSYGEGATYLPLAEIVRQAAPERPQATIAGLLAGDKDAALIAERVAELAGRSEGAAPTGELFWAVRRLLESLARTRPVIAVLEDVHWAEPTLLDLVEYLGAWSSDEPVLVLSVARPELLDQRPGWRTTTETIRLEPLSSDESETLLSGLGAKQLSNRTRARILEVAEGNALFVEQLLAYVTEDVGPERLDESVPPSIDALLASRLDALDAEERAVLERAAVVGKDFARSAVIHLSPPETVTMLDPRLVDLERRGLVHARRSPSSKEDEFRFHHVLIRDVAYMGITKERRADLHERHGLWLEQRNEPEELVGYHAEQAHRYTGELRASDPDLPRLASWAGGHLSAAGIRAWKRADTPAAVNLLGRATALLSPERQERVELLCELGVAQKVSGDFKRGEQTLIEASEAAVPDQGTRLRAQIELAHLHLFSDSRGATADLIELAVKAIPIFDELGDDRSLGRTWRHVGYVRGIEGRLADWQESVERALVHYSRSGWSASGCLAELAAALFFGPTPVAEALERCNELLDEATDRAGRANVLAFMGGLEAIEGRFDDARLRVNEAATTYEEIGELYALANNCGRVLGRIEMLVGDPPAAERTLEECCTTFERMHDVAGLSTVAAELADALYAQELYEQAGSWLDLAQKKAPAEDVSAQWTWRRVRGKLLAREGAHREAEALARKAAEIAARTDALSDHGTVLLDLAEVLLLSNKETEAAAQFERGLRLFEQKGNRVSAQAARAMLSELTVA
jgi:DNA-binding SARP family transcriptional activator